MLSAGKEREKEKEEKEKEKKGERKGRKERKLYSRRTQISVLIPAHLRAHLASASATLIQSNDKDILPLLGGCCHAAAPRGSSEAVAFQPIYL
jgi:hypothetical protein